MRRISGKTGIITAMWHICVPTGDSLWAEAANEMTHQGPSYPNHKCHQTGKFTSIKQLSSPEIDGRWDMPAVKLHF